MDMHGTSQPGSHNFFYETIITCAHKCTYSKCSGFQCGLKGFKQYLIVGRCLALNGLSLL